MPGEHKTVGASARGMQENAGECQENVREWVQSARGMLENAGGCRRMPEECTGVNAMHQGNAGECQWNVRKWVQSASGMLGNAKGTYGSGCKVSGECREM